MHARVLEKEHIKGSPTKKVFRSNCYT